jgi:hypothetical protein
VETESLEDDLAGRVVGVLRGGALVEVLLVLRLLSQGLEAGLPLLARAAHGLEGLDLLVEREVEDGEELVELAEVGRSRVDIREKGVGVIHAHLDRCDDQRLRSLPRDLLSDVEDKGVGGEVGADLGHHLLGQLLVRIVLHGLVVVRRVRRRGTGLTDGPGNEGDVSDRTRRAGEVRGRR